MAVTNGQLANQTTFNTAFVSRTTNTDTAGKLDLVNTDPASGAVTTNTQREINSLNSFTGRPAATAHDADPIWVSNELGNTTDSLKDRAEATDAEFNNTTGHAHSGAANDGAPIDAANLDNMNLFYAVLEKKTITVAGGIDDIVTTDFSGETAGGNDTTLGVVTTAPRNRVEILDANGGQIEDGSGNDVYARLTESAGVWTLTYFSSVAGVETSYSLTGQTIKIFYYEVFDQFTRPTFGAQAGEGLTSNVTDDVVDASATQRGVVSTGVQTFAGAKTFTGAISASNLSGTNTGDVTLAVIGGTPNANGASLSGQALNLQPADATFGGVLTALAQSIAGLKTFAAGVIAQTLFRSEGVVQTSEENNAASGSAQTLVTPAKEVVRLTNAALVSVAGLTAPTQVQKIILVNRTGVLISILNQNAGATAANRILTGLADDLDLSADASVILEYDLTTARWQVVGGSGSGGGGALTVYATESISAAGTITASVEIRELRRVQGNAAAVTANTTTPITAGTTEGQELILKGMSDTNTVTITNAGNVTLNGEITLYNGSVLSLVWIDSAWLEISRRE